MARATDARLVPAALAVWGTALTGILGEWWLAPLVGVGTVVVAALVVLVVRWCRPAWYRRTWPQAAVVAGLAVVSAVVTAVEVRDAVEHPLRIAAGEGRSAAMAVVVSDDPRRVGGAPSGRPDQRVVVEARLESYRVAGEPGVRRGRGRVLVIAPADSWGELLPGQELAVEGRLSPPRSGEPLLAVVSARDPPGHPSEPPWWQRGAGELREGLRDAARVLAPEPAGLLPALVVGDTSQQSPQVVEEFRTAGLTHLTAVSGSNLAVVCGAVLLAARAVGAGPRGSAVAAGVALVGFVVLARPEPSVLRAAGMGAVTLLALVLGRERSALPALAATVAALLLVDPALAVSAGFTLSVLATGGLVLLAPPWVAALRTRGVPAGLAEALVVPLAAQVTTAPVVAALSAEVSLVGVVANIVAAPVVAPATVFGVVAAVLSVWAPGVAEFFVRLAGPEVSWLIWVGRTAAGVSHPTLPWPAGAGGGLVLAAVLAVVLVAARSSRFRVAAVGVVLGGALMVVPARTAFPGWPGPDWSFVACDVGQGDALVLATGEPGRAVVVDAGPDLTGVGDCLRRLGVTRVPLVILSHLHADHVGGLDGVLAGRRVGAVALGPARSPTWAYEEVAAVAAGRGVSLVELRLGQRLRWSGLAIDVLGPLDGYVADETSGTEVNNASLVLLATTSVGRVLLTGDAELAAQSGLLGAGVDLAAPVLKVPHHGSRYTLPEFLARVAPRVAIISVGADNRYGHPSGQVIAELRALGATVVRTDLNGHLAVGPGPEGVRVRVWREATAG
ncbi:ComEC/Rec2 family competence protein [Actinoalloteichus caeruleus]|uniref:ComEC/Rec2 family competence protein n=1 Tax=Actinoalloteichus cyanogriseus TaxID=2893586 RepID=UPI003BB906F5